MYIHVDETSYVIIQTFKGMGKYIRIHAYSGCYLSLLSRMRLKKEVRQLLSKIGIQRWLTCIKSMEDKIGLALCVNIGLVVAYLSSAAMSRLLIIVLQELQCLLNCLHVGIIRVISLHQVSLLYTFQFEVR